MTMLPGRVRLAVASDLVGFAESAGFAPVAFGPELPGLLDSHRTFWTGFFRNFWRVQDLVRSWREVWEPLAQCRQQISTT